MKRLFFVLCALALAATTAYADVPCADCSDCTLDATGRMLLIPDENGTSPEAAGTFTLVIRNAANNPIANAVTEVLVGGLADNRTKLCGSAVTTKNTNAAGVVTFNIPGGGCLKNNPVAVVIRSNGEEIRSYQHVMSPDYANTDNNGLAGQWSLSISGPDFAAFAAVWQGGAGPATCHDYNNDGTMNGPDFSGLAAWWDGGGRDCAP